MHSPDVDGSGVDTRSLSYSLNPFRSTPLNPIGLAASERPRRFSLRDIADRLVMQQRVAAGFGWESVFRRECLMGLDAVADYEDQGIPREYIEKIQQMAEKLGVIIGIRPVARICRTLILELYASKPLSIKAKSANWGLQAGFLPVDQALSKKAGLEDEVAKYNRYVEECIADELAVAWDLSLSTARLDELKDLNVLYNVRKITPLADYSEAESFESSLKNEEQDAHGVFEAHKKDSEQWDIFVVKNGVRVTLQVLADKEYGPMTADFDLLFVDAHYSEVDLGQQDKPHGFHPKLGIYSKRMQVVATDINQILDRGPGKDMVHHGADTSNPSSKMEDNLPATILLPRKKMSIYESPLLIKTQEELACFMLTMQKMGYKTDINPQWEDLKDIAVALIRERVETYERIEEAAQ